MTIVVHLKSMLFAPSFAHYNTIMTVKISCIYKLRLSLKSAEAATVLVQYGSHVKHHL